MAKSFYSGDSVGQMTCQRLSLGAKFKPRFVWLVLMRTEIEHNTPIWRFKTYGMLAGMSSYRQSTSFGGTILVLQFPSEGRPPAMK